MRVTLDIDSLSPSKLFWSMFKQFLLIRRLPDVVRKTKKGYHLITYSLTFGTDEIKEREKRMLVTRLFCGDDSNRVLLDCNPKRIKQVLFSSKEIYMLLVCKDGSRFKFRVPRCSECGIPLPRFYIYHLSNRKHLCFKCFKNPYDIKIKTRQVERVLKKLGVDFHSVS